MGIGDLGWFNSSSSNTTNSTSQTSNVSQDQRVAVEGNITELVSPGAVIASPGGGAVNAAAPYTTVNMEVSGVSQGQMQSILDSIMASQDKSVESIAGIGQSVASGLTNQGKQLADILQQTKAPEQSTLSAFLPYAVVGLILLMMVKVKK